MITATLDRRALARLAKTVEGTGKRLDTQIKIAVNKTAKKTQTAVNAAIRTELATTRRAVAKTISLRKTANPKQNARVTLHATARMPVKEFKSRQIGKGVSYRISKNQGRKVAKSGFMGPRPGATAIRLRGHAFKRRGSGRLPIDKLHAVSPWGVFVKNGMRGPTVAESRRELRKQLNERRRYLKLKRKGKI